MDQIQLDFAIIGVQKSATSFLQTCLREHPQIYMPRGETAIFLPDHYEPNLRYLRDELSGKSEDQKCGIKRPDLMTESGCAERIHKHFPNCNLITILRDPVERAYSAFFHLMSIGYIPVMKPQKGFTELLTGRLEKKYPKSKTILDYGLYYKALQTYLDLFPSQNIFTLLHDDLKTDVYRAILSIYTFLGVDPDFIPTLKINTRVRASTYSLIRQKFYQIKNRQIYSFAEDGLSYRMKLDVSTLNWKIYGIVHKFDKNVLKSLLSNQKHLLTKDLLHELQQFYRNDIEKLESFTGRDLSSWKELPKKLCQK